MTGRRIRTVALIVGAVLVALGVVLAINVQNDPRTEGGRFIGKPAPEFTIETLDGETISTADLAGKTVLVNFWNTWCAPCEEEAPALAAFYEKYGHDPDFVMLGIVRADTAEAVKRYVAVEGTPWPVAMDDGSRAALAWGVTGQPETYAIRSDGIVVAELRSAASLDDLELMLQAAGGVA